jgi:hypothetical protein
MLEGGIRQSKPTKMSWARAGSEISSGECASRSNDLASRVSRVPITLFDQRTTTSLSLPLNFFI